MMYTMTFIEWGVLGVALFAASNIWFYLRVLRPIRQLAAQANQLSAGNLAAFDTGGDGIPEIQQLQRALAGMVGHVQRAQEQHQAYSAQLASGQENERKRIARELHDDTVQSLIGITQAIDLAKTFAPSDMERAALMLAEARAQAVDVVTRLRDLIAGLRPPALEELGLLPALQMQLEAVAEMQAALEVEGEPRRLDEAQELALFRAAQEALRNVRKHSAAAHVWVTVTYAPGEVTLQVRDDGRGFAASLGLGALAQDRHYGLLGLQERAAALDGHLTLNSTPGHGTTVTFALPTTVRAQPNDQVQDPVCSAWLRPQQAYGSVTYREQVYYFCCPVCQGAFQQDPAAYAS